VEILNAQGSRKNKFAFLALEAPVNSQQPGRNPKIDHREESGNIHLTDF
jgi:hypothetical protein